MSESSHPGTPSEASAALSHRDSSCVPSVSSKRPKSAGALSQLSTAAAPLLRCAHCGDEMEETSGAWSCECSFCNLESSQSCMHCARSKEQRQQFCSDACEQQQ